MIVEITLGITSILTILLGYTTYNQMKKVERLEDWVEEYAERAIEAKTQLDEIDSTGHFEADDEVGTIFEGIKDTVEDLNKITEQEI